MVTHKAIVSALAVCFLLAGGVGCTTTQPLPSTSPHGLRASISVEDDVRIEKHDGSSIEFTVAALSDDGIHGDGIFVPFDEIQRVSLVRESRLRTGLLIAAIVTAVVVLEKNADCGLITWFEDCDDD